MSFNEFMTKVRYWDNRLAKWITRHFYILFFEVFLVVIFLGLFVLFLKVIDASIIASRGSLIERLLLLQTWGSLLILLLLLLNSFWMLYVFNGVIRIKSLLREMNFTLSKRKLN